MSDQAAYVISQAACALIEALGMLADNQYQDHDPGHRRFWRREDFAFLEQKYGIDHNSVVETLREGK